MRAVIQRVLSTAVDVGGEKMSHIGGGLLVYLSVGKDDSDEDAKYVAEKLVNLRIFADEMGKMNRSISGVGGSILVVSNFTLHGDCRKGRRPGFDLAAGLELAERLYEKVVDLIGQQGVAVEKGVFGGHMHVSSINDGPVTFLLDSAGC